MEWAIQKSRYVKETIDKALLRVRATDQQIAECAGRAVAAGEKSHQMSGAGAEGLVRFMEISADSEKAESAALAALIWSFAAESLLSQAHSHQHRGAVSQLAGKQRPSRLWLDAAHKLWLASRAVAQLLRLHPHHPGRDGSTCSGANQSTVQFGGSFQLELATGMPLNSSCVPETLPSELTLWPVLLAHASGAAASRARTEAWTTIQLLDSEDASAGHTFNSSVASYFRAGRNADKDLLGLDDGAVPPVLPVAAVTATTRSATLQTLPSVDTAYDTPTTTSGTSSSSGGKLAIRLGLHMHLKATRIARDSSFIKSSSASGNISSDLPAVAVRRAAKDLLQAQQIQTKSERMVGAAFRAVNPALLHKDALESIPVLYMHEKARMELTAAGASSCISDSSSINAAEQLRRGDVAAARRAIGVSSGGEPTVRALARMPAVGLSPTWFSMRGGGKGPDTGERGYEMDSETNHTKKGKGERFGEGTREACNQTSHEGVQLRSVCQLLTGLAGRSRWRPDESTVDVTSITDAGVLRSPPSMGEQLGEAISIAVQKKYSEAAIHSQSKRVSRACEQALSASQTREPFAGQEHPDASSFSIGTNRLSLSQPMASILPQAVKDLLGQLGGSHVIDWTQHGAAVLRSAACAKHETLASLWQSETVHALSGIVSAQLRQLHSPTTPLWLNTYREMTMQSTIAADAAEVGVECAAWTLRAVRAQAEYCAMASVPSASCAYGMQRLVGLKAVTVDNGSIPLLYDRMLAGRVIGSAHLSRSVGLLEEAMSLMGEFASASVAATRAQSQDGLRVQLPAVQLQPQGRADEKVGVSIPVLNATEAVEAALERYHEASLRLHSTWLSASAASHRYAFDMMQQLDASGMPASGWPVHRKDILLTAATAVSRTSKGVLGLLRSADFGAKVQPEVDPTTITRILEMGGTILDLAVCDQPTSSNGLSSIDMSNVTAEDGHSIDQPCILVPIAGACNASILLRRLVLIDSAKAIVLLHAALDSAVNRMARDGANDEQSSKWGKHVQNHHNRTAKLHRFVRKAVEQLHDEVPCSRACIVPDLVPFRVHHSVANVGRCMACISRQSTERLEEQPIGLNSGLPIGGAFELFRQDRSSRAGGQEVERLFWNHRGSIALPRDKVLGRILQALMPPIRDNNHGLLSYLVAVQGQVAASVARQQDQRGNQSARHQWQGMLDVRRLELLHGLSHLAQSLNQVIADSPSSQNIGNSYAQRLLLSVRMEEQHQSRDAFGRGLVHAPGMSLVRRLTGRSRAYCKSPKQGIVEGCLWVPQENDGAVTAVSSPSDDDLKLLVPSLWPQSVYDCSVAGATNTGMPPRILHRESLAVPVPAAERGEDSGQGQQATGRTPSETCARLQPYSDLLSSASRGLSQMRRELLPALGICQEVCEATDCEWHDVAPARSGWRRHMQLLSIQDCQCCINSSSMTGETANWNITGTPRTGSFLVGRHDRENLATQGVWLQVPFDSIDVLAQSPTMSRLMDDVQALGGLPPRSGLRISLMFPGSHVKPHAGPHNVRWRLQLPLLVPCYVDCDPHSDEYDGPRLRVESRAYAWRRDQPFYFDDSLIHEVDYPFPPKTTWERYDAAEGQNKVAATGSNEEAVLGCALLGGYCLGASNGGIARGLLGERGTLPVNPSREGTLPGNRSKGGTLPRNHSKGSTLPGNHSKGGTLPGNHSRLDRVHRWWTSLGGESNHESGSDSGSAPRSQWNPCANPLPGDEMQCQREWAVWSQLPRAVVIVDTWPPAYQPYPELRKEIISLMDG